MIDFYNAFISYRHAKLDMSIAEHIQKKLEHFHVPHKLKKKLKHQKITRIFRDKDELPITSDLTETITDALQKAEYLIVICSTNTKESMWVKREIQTFLLTHTRDKILTVLCDGEPYDVIPEELLSMEKEVKDASGFPHTINVAVEPLSCDYRLPRSRADREELPRLASALLGCSYDELQRRRRQYRVRRAAAIIAAAFLAVAGVAGYSLYMTKKINDNYMQVLRSRAVYLATESGDLLDKDLRVDSVHLALAALPEDDKDKTPVTAEAVRALTEATAAYKSNSRNNFSPVWNYRTEYEIDKTIITDDNQFVGVKDRTGTVYCWNTLTHELVFEKAAETEVRDVLFLGNDTILILCANHLEVYNIQTGTKLWEYYTASDTHNYNSGDVVYANNSVFFDSGKGAILKFSVMDGKEKASYELKDSSDFLSSRYYNLAVSSDGKKIAFSDEAFAFLSSSINIYDTETDKLVTGNVDTYMFNEIKFIDNDHLCVVSDKELSDFSIIDISNEASYSSSAEKEITLFDGSLNELWSASITYSQNAFASGTLFLPSRNALVFYAGNAAVVYDLNSGAVLNTYDTGSPIIAANDYNMNGLPEFICKHGIYAFGTNPDKDMLLRYESLCNNITTGVIGDSIYVASRDSKDLIAYNRFLQDDEWTAVRGTEDKAGSNYSTSYSDNDYLIIAATVNDVQDIRISVIDPNDGTLRFSKDLEINGYLSNNFFVGKENGKYYGGIGSDIYLIDPENETVEKIYTKEDNDLSVSNGKIIRHESSFSGFSLTVSELDGSKPVEFTFETDEYLIFNSSIYVASVDKVFTVTDTRLFVADISTEKIEEITVPDNMYFHLGSKFSVTANNDGSQLLFTDGNTIWVTDSAFNEMYSFRCNGNYRFSALFVDKILYIVADDSLFMYDSTTGELIRKIVIGLFGKGDLQIIFDDEDHEAIIQIGQQVSIIDTDVWVETAYIENCFCYHAPTDRFFVYSYIIDTECTVGYIKHYSLDDLKAKAAKYLGTHELDEDTKAKYGLS
ncbi:MAG: TIR domain-containing protein [Clostridiales bacterium]|nr:TIR domain-containing protein [Clostridiales bacterium]